MVVTAETVHGLERDFPGIRVVTAATAPNQGNTVLSALTRLMGVYLDFTPGVAAVSVTVPGIRGGGSRLRQDYNLILDVRHLDRALPKAWVTAPSDSDIAHVNIWRSNRPDALCPWLGLRLPHLCWFAFEHAWARAAAGERTLGAALEFARQLLNAENHESSAR